jgi:hypothetical protein
MINMACWPILIAKSQLFGRVLTRSLDGLMLETMNGFLAICGICREIMS